MIKPEKLEDFSSDKIKTQEEVIEIVGAIKKGGKKVGLCVGAFDLLHAGHMLHLRSAKNLCDFLVIGVTNDSWLRKTKGEDRPIYTEQIRAFSISQLEYSDIIFIRDGINAVEAIYLIKPDFYIKGPGCKDNNTAFSIVEEREAIANVGGEMKYTEDEILSTTDIIKYIKNV